MTVKQKDSWQDWVCVSMNHVTSVRNRARDRELTWRSQLRRGKDLQKMISMFRALVDKTRDLIWIQVLSCRQQSLLKLDYAERGLPKGVNDSPNLLEGHTGLEIVHRPNVSRRNEKSALKRVLLKVCSQTSGINITWTFGRNENSQTSSKAH